MHPQWPPHAHALPQDAAGQSVKARYLAGPTCQHDLLAGQTVKARCIQPFANLFQHFFNARAHDADQFGAADLAAVFLPIAAVAAHFDHVAVIHSGGMHAAVFGLDPFRHRHRHLQTFGDIRGNMIAPHPNAVGIDHVLFHKDRNAGGAAPHINAGRPQFLFILYQTGDARHIGR